MIFVSLNQFKITTLLTVKILKIKARFNIFYVRFTFDLLQKNGFLPVNVIILKVAKIPVLN